MKKKPTVLLFTFLLLLAGCAMPQGNYRIRAVDANGADLTKKLVLMTSGGRGIYTIRNGICSAYPGATVLIEDIQSGQLLEGESPYRCRLQAAQTVFGQTFEAPAEIDYGGKLYKQAFKQEKGGRGLYEYTTDNETVDGWTHLITLQYKQGDTSDPLNWARTLKATLDKESPKPNYSLSVSGEHGYAQIIYEPDGKYSDYESNAIKSFHLPACGGLVVLQYAVKHSKETPPEGANPKDFVYQQVKRIALQSVEIEATLKAFAWMPKCGNMPN